MLVKLKIKNYALIDHLEMDLRPGFTVITGETGAGKSIMLGALALILGSRADTQVLLDTKDKCVVEGVFDIRNYSLDDFFAANDLDYDPNLIVRREISPTGKSRAFINDTPVTLDLMKELADKLINIHSQNATITLNNSDFQLAVIDSYAGIMMKFADYRDQYDHLKKLQAKLRNVIEEEEKSRAERDYLEFLHKEITEFNPQPGENKNLEERLNILSHAEEIKAVLLSSKNSLDEHDNSILPELSSIKNNLARIASWHHAAGSFEQRIDSLMIDLKDLASEMSHIGESIDYDKDELDHVNQRLNNLFHLQQKHKVGSADDLIGVLNSISARLNKISSLEDEILALNREIEELSSDLFTIAEDLSAMRTNVFEKIEKEISDSLSFMGMADAILKIKNNKISELTPDGIDQVRFLFSANRGLEPKELSKVASGGERSRLMLAIKSLISQKNLLPTIIFDEIDNGISGDIAGRVGDVMQKTSRNMQVIAITHLPQIAGKGQYHFTVYKEYDGKLTRSRMKELNPEGRVDELAKMLSGTGYSDAARITAQELLMN